MEGALRYQPAVRAKTAFLTLDNLDIVRNAFPALGVLSIDVDGNDYWFAEALIDLNPGVLVVEYNASFLRNSVATIYDPAFDRTKKHPESGTWFYHGASLAALAKLAARHGYGLAAVSEAGGNAFFTRTGTLDPDEAWRPVRLRDHWSGKSAEQQWEAIKDLPYVTI